MAPAPIDPTFCRVCVCLCNGIYRDEYFVYWAGRYDGRAGKTWEGLVRRAGDLKKTLPRLSKYSNIAFVTET